jgi:flagellar protein FliO/FliZ
MEIGEHITQIGLALALIVALVVALGYVVKRLNQGGLRNAGDIKVVASTFLGPKERILLVEVNDRQILVGVNPQSINALSEFQVGEAGAGTHAGGGSFGKAYDKALEAAL